MCNPSSCPWSLNLLSHTLECIQRSGIQASTTLVISNYIRRKQKNIKSKYRVMNYHPPKSCLHWWLNIVINRAARTIGMAFCPALEVLVTLTRAARSRALSPGALLVVGNSQCCCLLRLESRKSQSWPSNEWWKNVQPAVWRDPPVVYFIQMGHLLSVDRGTFSSVLIRSEQWPDIRHNTISSTVDIHKIVLAFIAQLSHLEPWSVICNLLPDEIVQILNMRHYLVHT